MNSAFVRQQAEAVVLRRQQDAERHDQLVSRLYRLVLTRDASESELAQCVDALQSGLMPTELAQTLLVSNEFLFVD